MLVICSNSEMKSPASGSKLNSLFIKYNAFIEATNATCIPGGLPNKFTTSKKPYTWIRLFEM